MLSRYLSWQEYFMAVAVLSAQRSKDPNKQVGACIVGRNRVILGIGYNGFPRGCDDSQLPWAKKSAKGLLGTKYPYVVRPCSSKHGNRTHLPQLHGRDSFHTSKRTFEAYGRCSPRVPPFRAVDGELVPAGLPVRTREPWMLCDATSPRRLAYRQEGRRAVCRCTQRPTRFSTRTCQIRRAPRCMSPCSRATSAPSCSSRQASTTLSFSRCALHPVLYRHLFRPVQKEGWVVRFKVCFELCFEVCFGVRFVVCFQMRPACFAVEG